MAQFRLGRLAITGRAHVAALVAATLVVGGLSAPVAAHDPWRPLGRTTSDDSTFIPLPRGYVDIQGPVIVDPPGVPPRATTRRTNIVMLVIDDIAEMDERVWDRLPTIRSLFVDHGLRFTNAFGNDPLCCPGRANILTGLTTDHHGVYTNNANLLDPRVTLATELQGVGYYTFMTGKYLNGGKPLTDPTPPGWSRTAYTGNAYYNYNEWVDGIRVHHDDDANDYQPDVAFNRAMAMLRAAPPAQPVFAFLNPFTVHAGPDPRHPDHHFSDPAVADRYVGSDRCTGIDPWLTPAHADDNGDRPMYQRGWNFNRSGYDLQADCEALLATDEGLARIVRELKAQGRFQNTLFVLVADNGMGYGAHGWRAKTTSFAAPITLYLSWASGRGRERADDATFVSNVDLAPTLCAVGGCLMGPYRDGRKKADGVSLLPLIDGTATLRRKVVYTEHLTGVLWRSIRTSPDYPLGMWTYTRYSTDERELYEVSGGPCVEWHLGDPGDPCELTNLAGVPEYAAIEQQLSDLLDVAVATGGAAKVFRARIIPHLGTLGFDQGPHTAVGSFGWFRGVTAGEVVQLPLLAE